MAAAVHKSEENYLKAIFVLKLQKETICSVDIVEFTGYSRPSISNAIHKLVDRGYVIKHDGWGGAIELTPEGEKVAKNIFERHQLICDWLMRLGVDPERADEEACNIEHDISDDTFELIKAHVSKALQFLGDDKTYEQKMSKMAEMMSLYKSNTPGGMTQSSKIMQTVSEHGGIHKITEAIGIINAHGGIEGIKEKAELVDVLGGATKVVEMAKVIERAGGADNISQKDTCVEELGGMEKAFYTGMLIEKIGGIGNLRKLVIMSDEVGGEDNLFELIKMAQKVRGDILNMENKTHR